MTKAEIKALKHKSFTCGVMLCFAGMVSQGRLHASLSHSVLVCCGRQWQIRGNWQQRRNHPVVRLEKACRTRRFASSWWWGDTRQTPPTLLRFTRICRNEADFWWSCLKRYNFMSGVLWRFSLTEWRRGWASVCVGYQEVGVPENN